MTDLAAKVGWSSLVAETLEDESQRQELTGGPGGEAPRVRLRPFINLLTIMQKDRKKVKLRDAMNYAQSELLDDVERQINDGGDVRIIVLKARQLGISTIIEAIIFTMSILFNNYQSLIISHESDSAEHILGMTKRYWTTYPFRQFHDEQYNGRKQLSWGDLESNIVIATAKNTGAGRSRTLHALHASEVAFWDTPEELMTGLRQAIPTSGITMIFLESTANGVGNYFHRNWEAATSGASEFTPLFFPWHKHPEYTAKNIPRRQKVKYNLLNNPTAEEDKLRLMGLSDARLLWRRWAIANLCDGDEDKFKQEYPTTENEAFLMSGRNVFNLLKLQDHYRPMRGKVGRLEMSDRGRVRFVEDREGVLEVYRFPADDKSWGIYHIGADPTHTTAGDKACAHVISRRTLEQCAVLTGHMDPVEFGRQLEMLGYFYNTATIAPEKEGPGYATIGYLLGKEYPMVWESQKTDKTPGKIQHDVYGWGTNRTTKAGAIGYLNHDLSQPIVDIGYTVGLVIHHRETFEELRDYQDDGKGGFENGRGSMFDDTVMSLAITLATHRIDPPVPPHIPGTTQMAEAVQEVRELTSEKFDEMKKDLFEKDEHGEEAPAPWEDWK